MLGNFYSDNTGYNAKQLNIKSGTMGCIYVDDILIKDDNSSGTSLKDKINSLQDDLANVVRNYTGTITLEQITEGATLIPAVPGYSIKPLRYFIKSTGDFSSGGGTNMLIQDDNIDPVVVTTVAKEALTDGAKISSEVTDTKVTDGVGMLSALTKGKALIVRGASFGGGTSVTISIDYMLV